MMQFRRSDRRQPADTAAELSDERKPAGGPAGDFCSYCTPIVLQFYSLRLHFNQL